MGIANYTDLAAAIETTIDDTFTTAEKDDFIALAEARLVRDLKTAELHVTTTMTVDEQSEDLPTDFSSFVRGLFSSSYPTLDYMSPDEFWRRYVSSNVGHPIAFTIEANKIYFGPSPDDTYTLTYTYIAKPDIKTDVTNRLLTIYPDVYLFACLVEAADHNQDDLALTKYEARYQQAVKSINESDQYKGQLAQYLDGVP